MRIKEFWQKHVLDPLITILFEGISPKKLALTVAFGYVLGTIPILGITTILCLVFAFILGLNKPAIMGINFLVYPLQLAFYIPYIRTGLFFFGHDEFNYSIWDIVSIFREDMYKGLVVIAYENGVGVLAWFIISIPVFMVIYYLFLRFFRRIM